MVEHLSVALDGTYHALAHRTRRAMVESLRGGEARVTELAAPFEMSLAAASKHVRVLESAGLISRTVRGRDHVLSLELHPLLEAGEWIADTRTFWEQRLDALDAQLRAGRRP